VKEFNREGISWSSQGMLKLSHSVMERLFQTTLDKILQVIQWVLFKRGLIEGTCNHGGLVSKANGDGGQDRRKSAVPRTILICLG
jgi:hypothetical protein